MLALPDEPQPEAAIPRTLRRKGENKFFALVVVGQNRIMFYTFQGISQAQLATLVALYAQFPRRTQFIVVRSTSLGLRATTS